MVWHQKQHRANSMLCQDGAMPQIKKSCHKRCRVATVWWQFLVSYNTVSCQGGAVSKRHLVSTMSCHYDVAPTRCRIKTVSCQHGAVSTRYRASTTPNQNKLVLTPRCIKTTPCQPNTVSMRCRFLKRCGVIMVPCQDGVESAGTVSRRRRVNTTSWQYDTVPTNCLV